MHIRYLLLDNGIEFEDDVVTADKWADVKPKTVCTTDSQAVFYSRQMTEQSWSAVYLLSLSLISCF